MQVAAFRRHPIEKVFRVLLFILFFLLLFPFHVVYFPTMTCGRIASLSRMSYFQFISQTLWTVADGLITESTHFFRSLLLLFILFYLRENHGTSSLASPCKKFPRQEEMTTVKMPRNYMHFGQRHFAKTVLVADLHERNKRKGKMISFKLGEKERKAMKDIYKLNKEYRRENTGLSRKNFSFHIAILSHRKWNSTLI